MRMSPRALGLLALLASGSGCLFDALAIGVDVKWLLSWKGGSPPRTWLVCQVALLAIGLLIHAGALSVGWWHKRRGAEPKRRGRCGSRRSWRERASEWRRCFS